MEITLELVKNLVKQQFPKWSDLEISPVENGGWDNRTFHLGDKLSVRLPSAEGYVEQVINKRVTTLDINFSHPGQN